MAYDPAGSSVVAFQSNPSVLQTLTGLMSTNASVITVGSSGVANQSVSGTIGASIIGAPPANIFVGGAVATTSNPLPVSPPLSGFLPVNLNTSTNASVITVGSPVANQSVSGTVNTLPIGTIITSVVSTVPSSVLVGASIFGQLPAGTAMLGSVVAYQGAVWNVAGSVAAFQAGTRSTSISGQITVVSSVAGGIFPISGSVAAVMTAWQNPSIVGTYSEDAAHTSADRGLFTLGVRNDTVSSFVGANSEYTPYATDSAGRTLVKPFAAGEASVIAHTSLVSSGTTASVQVFGAAGAGLKNYMTDFFISNTGAATTLVIFGDGDGSILGRTIAPTGGGSNGNGLNTPIVNVRANTPINIQLGSSSSVVYLSAFGYRAP